MVTFGPAGLPQYVVTFEYSGQGIVTMQVLGLVPDRRSSKPQPEYPRAYSFPHRQTISHKRTTQLFPHKQTLEGAYAGESEGRQGMTLTTSDSSQRPQVMGTRVMLMDHLNDSPCAL